MQYGAVGVVAAGLLTLVVVLFRQFVQHALEQNKELLKRHDSMLEANLNALHGVRQAINETNTIIREVKVELGRDIGQLFNEVSAITEGSRVQRPRPPSRTPPTRT